MSKFIRTGIIFDKGTPEETREKSYLNLRGIDRFVINKDESGKETVSAVLFQVNMKDKTFSNFFYELTISPERLQDDLLALGCTTPIVKETKS